MFYFKSSPEDLGPFLCFNKVVFLQLNPEVELGQWKIMKLRARDEGLTAKIKSRDMLTTKNQ